MSRAPNPARSASLPASRLAQATLRRADLPGGWISRPKLAANDHKTSSFCNAHHPHLSGRSKSVAFTTPGPAFAVVEVELKILRTPADVNAVLDRAKQDIASCSRFMLHRKRYTIADVLLPLDVQRYVGAVLHFDFRKRHVVEYVALIKQDNALVEVVAATPFTDDVATLVTAATTAIKKVVYAESHSAPLAA